MCPFPISPFVFRGHEKSQVRREWADKSVGTPSNLCYRPALSWRWDGMIASLSQCNKLAELWILLSSDVLFTEKLIYNSKLIGHTLKYILYLPDIGYSDYVLLEKVFFFLMY